jgi:hypothetical protein
MGEKNSKINLETTFGKLHKVNNRNLENSQMQEEERQNYSKDSHDSDKDNKILKDQMTENELNV